MLGFQINKCLLIRNFWVHYALVIRYCIYSNKRPPSNKLQYLNGNFEISASPSSIFTGFIARGRELSEVEIRDLSFYIFAELLLLTTSRFSNIIKILLKVWTKMPMCEQSSFILSTSSSNFLGMARLGVLASKWSRNNNSIFEFSWSCHLDKHLVFFVTSEERRNKKRKFHGY